ncbi:MAG: hypothetical protein RR543_04840 [Erysipelotrichales bacterium]
MKRVLLLGAAGITTTLLTEKLGELMREVNEDYQVIACSVAEVATKGVQAEIILLSPQVRFNYAKIQQMFPEKVVLKIGVENFMSLNAEKVVEDLKNNLNNN